MAVVTISSELGAGGPEIGASLAARLGYRYLDREVISEAAQQYGLVEAKLVHLDEEKPSLFDRVDAEGRLYIAGTKAVLWEFAQSENVVLMGRGGQCLLRDLPHALHVRVRAPFEVRVARLGRRIEGETGKTPPSRALADVVRRDDAARSGRLRYLYGVDIRDPALYHVVVNTAQVPVAAAVEVLLAMVCRPEFATTDAGRKVVVDRRLAALVEVALAKDPQMRRRRVAVTAEDGVVTLEGITDPARAETIVRAVPGVRDVKMVWVEPSPPGLI